MVVTSHEPSVPPARVDRRRARNRATMLEQAEALFADRGYREVRIEEVAAAADLSVGSIYTHFGSKDGLFAAVAELVLDAVADRMGRVLEDSADPVERVWACADAFLDAILARPFIVRFMTADAAAPGDVEVRQRLQVRLRAMYDFLGQLVEEANGVVRRDDLDAREVARFLIGSWIGMAALAFGNADDEFDVEALKVNLAQAARMLADGLLLERQG